MWRRDWPFINRKFSIFLKNFASLVGKFLVNTNFGSKIEMVHIFLLNSSFFFSWVIISENYQNTLLWICVGLSTLISRSRYHASSLSLLIVDCYNSCYLIIFSTKSESKKVEWEWEINRESGSRKNLNPKKWEQEPKLHAKCFVPLISR